MSQKKYLALDIGFARVGTAIGESQIGLAFPREILAYNSYISDIEKIIDAEKIDAIVVGVPNNLSGEMSEHTEKIFSEINRLKKIFAQKNIPIHTFDEQFTTKIAEQSLQFMGIKAKKQKNKKDAMAAAIILQGFLDYTSNKTGQ